MTCQFLLIVTDQVFGDQKHHSTVRKDIVNWLAKNPNFLLDDEDSLGGTLFYFLLFILLAPSKISDFIVIDSFPTWRHYVQYMSRDGAWGDQFTLIATAEVYGLNVFVISSGNSKHYVHCTYFLK